MQIKCLYTGKTEFPYVKSGIDVFSKRISNYLPYKSIEIPSLKQTKNMPADIKKGKEAALQLQQIQLQEKVYLLDEHGAELNSVDFAAFIQQQMNRGTKVLTFVVGGPYGFGESMKQRADGLISLSKMTFSHQLIRLIFAEQLYRAMTIIHNEPYHNV